MFPSPSILQHYAKFNIRTLITLEKLFGARSFGGSIDHLARHEATLLVSLGGVGFHSIVRSIAPTFLKCWTLIALAIIIHFQ
jgi:hypothetical protein